MATSSSISTSSNPSFPPPPNTTTPLTFPSAQHFLSIKLNASNFLIWRKQITPFLKGQGLFGFLDGSHPQPTDPIAATAWQQQDAQLVSLLVASLSEDLVPLLLDKETSFECWTTLHEAFGSASPTRLMSLHLELQNLRQKSDETVTSLLRRAKAVADELAASGNALKPTEFNLHVLRALCDDLQDAVPGILNRHTPPTYTELHGLLLSHESMRAFRKLTVADATPTNPIVNTAQRFVHSSNDPRPSIGRGFTRGRGGRGKFGRGHGRFGPPGGRGFQ